MLSSWSQQRLLDLLRRREALLRLVGAERVLAASLVHFFKAVHKFILKNEILYYKKMFCQVLVMRGVSVMTAEGPSKALEFLEKASPPGVVCFLVIVTRLLAVPVGNIFSAKPIELFVQTSGRVV